MIVCRRVLTQRRMRRRKPRPPLRREGGDSRLVKAFLDEILKMLKQTETNCQCVCFPNRENRISPCFRESADMLPQPKSPPARYIVRSISPHDKESATKATIISSKKSSPAAEWASPLLLLLRWRWRKRKKTRMKSGPHSSPDEFGWRFGSGSGGAPQGNSAAQKRGGIT